MKQVIACIVLFIFGHFVDAAPLTPAQQGQAERQIARLEQQHVDFIDYGRITTRGSQSWHLVNTGEDWKISSMIYSVGHQARALEYAFPEPTSAP